MEGSSNNVVQLDKAVTKVEELEAVGRPPAPQNGPLGSNTVCGASSQLHPIAPAGGLPMSAVVSSTTANAGSGAAPRDIHYASDYYREWILEAIDKLRERKARPDAERITTLMKRYHNIPFADTQRCLDKLADKGQVVCVDYKGNISYRNPRRWRKCGSTCVLNPPSVSKIILDVVMALVAEKRSRTTPSVLVPDVSFTIQELESHLRAKNVPQLMNGCMKFDIVLERECTYGCLVRRVDGRLMLDENRERKRVLIASKKFYRPPSSASIKPPPTVSTCQTASHWSVPSSSSSSSYPIQSHVSHPINSETMSYAAGRLPCAAQPNRTVYSAIQPAPYPKGSRQQQFAVTGGSRPIASKPAVRIDSSKAMPRLEPRIRAPLPPTAHFSSGTQGPQWLPPSASHDVSLHPPVSALPPTLPIQANVCSECGGVSSTSKKLYSCADCRMKAHLSCLGFWVHDPMEPATWQCPKCISCCLCRNRQSLDRLMVCATCSQAYHSQCHSPKITEQVEDFKPWVCQPCNDKGIYFIETPEENLSEASCLSASPDKKLEANKEAAVVKPTPALLEYIPTSQKTSSVLSSVFTNEMQSVSSTTMSASRKNDVTKANLSESDMQLWAMEDVAAWLNHVGFCKEALLFLENEIDGPSLLLMKSIEIISQTGVKLGPAIKIHEKLKKILSPNKNSPWK